MVQSGVAYSGCYCRPSEDYVCEHIQVQWSRKEEKKFRGGEHNFSIIIAVIATHLIFFYKKQKINWHCC